MLQRPILIIEDEPKFRNSIKFTLRNEGYSFVEVESVRDALEVCRNPRAAKVILLDLELPDGTGRDFLERLGPAIDKFKIIVLTGHDESLAADLARQFQVFRYLPKGPKISEALRFTTSEAFKNIELEQLLDKNKTLIRIQEKIHSEIPESNSIEGTHNAMIGVLKSINDAVRDIVGAYTSHIRLYDLRTGDYRLAAFAGPSEDLRHIFNAPKRKSEPFSGMIAGEKQPHNFADLQADANFQKWKTELLNRLKNDGALGAAREYISSVRSVFIAPISTHLFSDEIDAVFNVSADSKDFFSADKQEIILEFAAQATAAITKGWQKVRKRETHLDYQRVNHVLEDVSRNLGAEDAKRNIYDIVGKGIYEIIKPENITLYLYNKTTGLLDNEAEFRAGEPHEPSQRGDPANRGLTAFVFTDGKPLRIPNLQRDDRRKPLKHANANKQRNQEYVQRLPSGRVDHYLGVPMVIGDEVIGAIQLLNKTSDYYGDEAIDPERWLLERGFSDDNENVLAITAAQLAMAIRNTDLLDQNRKQISQLKILTEVGRFRSSEAVSELLDKIIREAAAVVQAEVCLLFLLNENRTKVVLNQRYGISKDDLSEASYDLGESYTGRVAQTLKSYLSEQSIPRGKYDRQVLRHLQKIYGKNKTIESLMIVPIIVKGELLGVIKTVNKRNGERFDVHDLNFLEQFANYVGLAIENVQLYALSSQKLATAERNATLSNLVAAVAHEINNTQGLIPANVELIKERLSRGNFEIKEMLDVIEDAAGEAISFANSIHPFATSRLGEKTVLDVNTILHTALNQLPGRTEKRVTVEVRLSSEPLRCQAYETPLVQVFRNVIVNAYQSMENRKPARLKIVSWPDRTKGVARISFADSGCGIKAESLPYIYDADFTTKQSGTGIGLWLAKTHLDAIDATITAESAVNKGTTFTIEIPLAHE